MESGWTLVIERRYIMSDVRRVYQLGDIELMKAYSLNILEEAKFVQSLTQHPSYWYRFLVWDTNFPNKISGGVARQPEFFQLLGIKPSYVPVCFVIDLDNESELEQAKYVLDLCTEYIENEGIEYSGLNSFTSNPSPDEIMRRLDKYERFEEKINVLLGE